MDITNIVYNGKTNLSAHNSNGTFDDFDIEINGRVVFNVFAEISDINRHELDVCLVSMLGANGLFPIKERYFEKIQEHIKQFVAENEENWRQSEYDWAEYFNDLKDEY